MKYCMAPMEGITGYVYRNVHHLFFPEGMDRFYTPFLNTNHLTFTNKEKKDIMPENNKDINVIPQILTRKAGDFVWAVHTLAALGYEEVNLNLGCPAPTVVKKGKGAGLLADPDDLDAFLNEIFEQLAGEKIRISLKTRIGMHDPEEMNGLMEVYNKYPICELVIHSRVRDDFYRNHANLEAFEKAFTGSRIPICYNGDITTAAENQVILSRFPDLNAVMLGRGLIANPALVREITQNKSLTQAELKQFLQSLWDAYDDAMESELNVICKMKELWVYMGSMFSDSERYVRKIQKAQTKSEYRTAVNNLMGACAFRREMHVDL